MKKIKNILTLIFVFMAAVSLSSCFCAYDPYYPPTPVVYVGSSHALARELDNAAWQAQQRANTARQAYENELWQRTQR